MEGFVQGIKFKSPEMQREVCKMSGLAAKKRGANKNWQRTQTLWWQGEPIARESEEYQQLLDEAFKALFTGKALIATGDVPLTHKIGRRNPKETVLTQSEFCSRLCSKLHHEAGIELVRKQFGDRAAEAARLHIESDLMQEGWEPALDPFPKDEAEYKKMGFF